MTKPLLVLALIAIAILGSYAQITFEDGYFIDESNQKIECLIKNVDWRYNPTAFKYKLSEDGAVQTASVREVKEFRINNGAKYISTKVKIDRSGDRLSKLSDRREPNFQEEWLFLKVLIEGEASLFFYRNENLTRFFYTLNEAEIQQLVHKRYLRIGKKISSNNYYKQQLTLALKCETIALNDLERLEYTSKDLEKLFIKYNECRSSDYTNFVPGKKRDWINLSLRAGINYSSLEINEFFSTVGDMDFGSSIGVRFGVETEFILPYNKNKWRIIVEPTYQSFNSEQSKATTGVPGGVLVSTVDYKSLEVPIGLRHCFYLNGQSKIFANVSYVFDFAFDSSIEFSKQDGSLLNGLDVSAKRNVAMGVGYNFKDRYGLEIRYYARRGILRRYSRWSSDYRVLSMVLGYSFY